MNLYIITQSYPYTIAAEQTFLDQELPFLSTSFENVFIIPQSKSDTRVDLHFKNVHVIDDFAIINNNKKNISNIIKLITLFFSYDTLSLFFKEISNIWKTNNFFKKLLKMLKYILTSYMFYIWAKKFIKKNEFHNSIFYSFWFDTSTLGSLILKGYNSRIIVITRSHNFDLFEYRHEDSYIPYRSLIVSKLDRIFPCMSNGADYLKNKYNIKNTFYSYLGINDNKQINKPSSDGILRLVSCSNMNQIKRVNLIIEALEIISNEYKNILINWTHFGHGQLYDNLNDLAKSKLKDNVSYNLKGHVELKEIFNHYKGNPIDIFINVSSAEGQPVSIKEAISYGIPIIATDVGGNSEIVSDNNGILLTDNPTPMDIVIAILWFYNNPMKALKMRENSRKLFLNKYASDVVYPDFISKIREIIK